MAPSTIKNTYVKIVCKIINSVNLLNENRLHSVGTWRQIDARLVRWLMTRSDVGLIRAQLRIDIMCLFFFLFVHFDDGTRTYT